MPKKRGKRTVNKPANAAPESNQEELQKGAASEHEDSVERQSAAIRALREVEIEQLRTMIRLLCSNFSNEQLQVPVLQFFRENLPNLAVSRNENDGTYEVQWRKDGRTLAVDQLDGRNINTSLLQKLSVIYPNCSTAIPSFGGFEFSNKSVTNVFGAKDLQIKGLVLEEPVETLLFDQQDPLQTPAFQVHNNRLSVGMTPKTLRFPKHGEMLLSVHGSPLGVYKEDMEAIHESEDGCA
ncbi:unnamed protein product [Cuscuta epithymum]|uniref:Borealin C-terminal domain-containing protein n=1 Tax=Cuscuta epithymum TaxID=186058 RepID=A0AAV0CKW1_9ASTE|nr:unnamed protein product [Cuscuta epithymum]